MQFQHSSRVAAQHSRRRATVSNESDRVRCGGWANTNKTKDWWEGGEQPYLCIYTRICMCGGVCVWRWSERHLRSAYRLGEYGKGTGIVRNHSRVYKYLCSWKKCACVCVFNCLFAVCSIYIYTSGSIHTYMYMVCMWECLCVYKRTMQSTENVALMRYYKGCVKACQLQCSACFHGIPKVHFDQLPDCIWNINGYQIRNTKTNACKYEFNMCSDANKMLLYNCVAISMKFP